ncbi:MAG: MFS transporter [Muribaculaceae bacterium]
MLGLKSRLAVMNFMQFAIWGSYLTCIGNYIGPAGLGTDIAWFYSVQGIVSIFMPAIIGIIADKYVSAQKLLGVCHTLAAIFMFAAWWYGYNHAQLEFSTFFTLYTCSVAFYMPTIALSNTVAFSILSRNGYDTIKDFPPIRVLGTVGFIASMWFVNFAFISPEGVFGFSTDSPFRFQYTDMQLFVCGILGILLGVYSFSLPNCPISPKTKDKVPFVEMLGLNAFKLFKQKKMAMFFIFSMLLGVSLQITNGFATPFITSFKGIPEFANTVGANNATALTSLSQISEALCILLIPFFLKRYGIKNVMLIAMYAWVLRFGLFGLGNPGAGLWMFVLSMIVYGVAFDFFNVSGALFVQQETDKSIQGSAQGLFMLMTNGIGATVGTLIAGDIVNYYCQWKDIAGSSYLVGDWQSTWLIFAGYALVVFVLFAVLFRYKHQPEVKPINK